jgi:hypothetical protein
VGAATFTLTATDDYRQKGIATVSVHFAEPSPSAPPFVIITSPSGGLEASYNAHFAGAVTDAAGGPVTYRWSIFDPKSSIDTQIARAASFDFPIDMKYEGRTIEIRLAGTNNRGVTTLRTESLFVQPLPR